jgi:hypothetical protein
MTATFVFGLLNTLAGLFPVMWLGGVIAIVTIAARRAARRRAAVAAGTPLVDARRADWPTKLLFGVMASYILLTIAVGAAANRVVARHARESLARDLVAVRISGDNIVRLIEGRAEARALADLLTGGDDVAAHHSSPVDTLVIALPELGETWVLGRDSNVADEFWFSSGDLPGLPEHGRHVRQFRNPALTAWLSTHGFARVRATASPPPR